MYIGREVRRELGTQCRRRQFIDGAESQSTLFLRRGSTCTTRLKTTEDRKERKTIMCGRITCYLAPEDLSCSCKYRDVTNKDSVVPWVPQKFQTVEYVPSYNMGPRDSLVCIVAGSHFNNESERVLCPMMWGLIPPWHKGEYKKHNASTHNARLEGLNTSKLYGKPLAQGKRCVVVVNGFYEWQTDKKSGVKQAYYMYKKTSDDVITEPQVLNLAGLFDKWTSEEGQIIYSGTIITTAANDVLSWLHHRAPVVLQTDKDIQDWLSYKTSSGDEAVAKLHSKNLSATALQWHPVGSTVNNVRNKDKTCIEPVALSKAKEKTSGGLMSAWLKTGSMKPNKRKSTEGEDDEDSDSKQPKSKEPRTN